MTEIIVSTGNTARNSTEREILDVFRLLNEENQAFYHRLMLQSLESQRLVKQMMNEQGMSEDGAYAALIDMHRAEVSGLLYP